MNFQQLEFQPRAGGSSLAARLRREVEGDVLFDRASRGRYATDASIYQVEPVGVVVPKSEADALRAMQIAIDAGVPVLPRGAGTSQCGQTVGAALVIDNSKHLGGIIEFDLANATATVQPGIVLDTLNAFLRPHGLWFPVDVSTSAQATIGGMAGNNSCGSRSIRYGNMVHSVLAVDAVLADGAAFRFGPSDETASGPPAYRALVGEIHAIIRREADEIAARWPTVLRRVQGYNLDMVQPHRSHNLAHLLIGSEGTLAYSRRLTLKLASIPAHKTLGVCHFPTFRQAMDRRAAHRQARPRRRRAGRSHDDRPGAREPGVRARRRALHPRCARGDPAGRVRRRRACGAGREARRARRAHGRSRSAGQRRRGPRLQVPEGDLGGPQGGTQHHDVDEGRREAGLVHRGLRGPARASRRVHRPPDAGLREARHEGHLVRARVGRHAARAAGAQHERRWREEDAPNRRGSLCHGARVQGRGLLRRARRRPRPLGVDRAHHRPPPRRRAGGDQGPVRPEGPDEPRQDRPAVEDGRCLALSLQAGLCNPAPGRRARLVGVGRAGCREPGLRGGSGDVQQQRPLPQVRCRDDVPVVPRDRRRTASHARPREHAAAGGLRAAGPGGARLGRRARRDGPLRRLQGLQARVPDRRRHGADEDRVPASLPRPPRSGG